MEGAVLAGKLAAEVIAARAAGQPTQGVKAVTAEVEAAAASAEPKDPMGIKGNDPVSFGGGSCQSDRAVKELKTIDPAQLAPLG